MTVLEFIKKFAVKNGILPTYREISEGTGLKSLSSVAYQMQKLELSRDIERIGCRYKVRGLEYVNRPCHEPDKE